MAVRVHEAGGDDLVGCVDDFGVGWQGSGGDAAVEGLDAVVDD